MQNNEKRPIPADLRLGAPPTGSAYADAVEHLEKLKQAKAEDENFNSGWEPKRPGVVGSEDHRISKVIEAAEEEVRRRG